MKKFFLLLIIILSSYSFQDCFSGSKSERWQREQRARRKRHAERLKEREKLEVYLPFDEVKPPIQPPEVYYEEPVKEEPAFRQRDVVDPGFAIKEGSQGYIVRETDKGVFVQFGDEESDVFLKRDKKFKDGVAQRVDEEGLSQDFKFEIVEDETTGERIIRVLKVLSKSAGLEDVELKIEKEQIGQEQILLNSLNKALNETGFESQFLKIILPKILPEKKDAEINIDFGFVGFGDITKSLKQAIVKINFSLHDISDQKLKDSIEALQNLGPFAVYVLKNILFVNNIINKKNENNNCCISYEFNDLPAMSAYFLARLSKTVDINGTISELKDKLPQLIRNVFDSTLINFEVDGENIQFSLPGFLDEMYEVYPEIDQVNFKQIDKDEMETMDQRRLSSGVGAVIYKFLTSFDKETDRGKDFLKQSLAWLYAQIKDFSRVGKWLELLKEIGVDVENLLSEVRERAVKLEKDFNFKQGSKNNIVL